MQTNDRAFKISLIIGLLLTFMPAFSQTKSRETAYTYLLVDKLPVFPGGRKALVSFLDKNIIWPDKGMDVQGSVLMSFVITKDGNIIDIKVEKSLNQVFDNEAKRIIILMPKWTPGEVNGKRVNTRVYLPVNFFLTS